MAKKYYRHISRCLLLVLFIFLFTGCTGRRGSAPCSSDGVTAAALLEAIENSQKSLPPCRNVLRKDAATESCRYLSPATAGLLYADSKTGVLPEYERMKQCFVRLADSQCGFEIHVMEGKSAQDTEVLEELCRNRLHSLQTRELHLYLQDAYERNVAAGQVIVRGRFVFLLLTEDNPAAVNAIDALL